MYTSDCEIETSMNDSKKTNLFDSYGRKNDRLKSVSYDYLFCKQVEKKWKS